MTASHLANKPFSADDYRYMAMALKLAARGMWTTSPNPRVGCVIVQNGQLVGEGWHAKAGEPHAEPIALASAGDSAKGATAYVTLEPCSHQGRTPPCADALIAAGLGRVVIAMADPNPLVAGSGIEKLEAAGIETQCGLLEAQAKALNPGFVNRMTIKRPFVRVKLAATLDGKTALANGESKWITGAEARADVQRLRARSCAILTGIDTVLADDPAMNVRLDHISAESIRQPVRVVMDSNGKMPASAKMLSLPGRSVVLTTKPDMRISGAEQLCLPSTDSRIDLPAALSWMAEQLFNEVHVEAGATLSGALMRAGLVDELVLYTAAKFFGSSARGLLDIGELHSMRSVERWEIADSRRIGADQRIILRPN